MPAPTASRLAAIATTDREALTFTVERVFEAPPARVFAAFADCESLVRWWGPTDWTLPVCQQDFRPGGTWLYGMQGPEGHPQFGGVMSYGKATYLEIDPPDRLVYLDEFVDADGEALPDMPRMTIELDFLDEGGRTRLRNTTRFASLADLETVARTGMEEGLAQTWDRLEVEVTAPTSPTA
jgi:uncharacterized protein YndB with AHSA1/START domain